MPLAAAGKLEIAPEVGKQTNITSDSTSGWTPTADQRLRSIATVARFLDALEKNSYAEAYGLQAEQLRGYQTLEQFTEAEQAFKTLAGPWKFSKVLKITWTKDSPRAPVPGTFVVADLASGFANIDRHCGYVVLYQPPTGGDFAIMRRESNYLDNANAAKIEAEKSKAEVANLWAQLSSHCPNYVPAPQ
jgi:hypothetical protein